MSVADRLVEFARLAAEKMMIGVNETSTERNATSQSSTTSGKQYKSTKRFQIAISFSQNMFKTHITLKVSCISQASLTVTPVETTTVQMADSRVEKDTLNIVLLSIYIVQGFLMVGFNVVLFLGIAVRVLKRE